MATIFRWDSLRILLALAAISVALLVTLVGCGGGEESPPPASDLASNASGGACRRGVPHLGAKDRNAHRRAGPQPNCIFGAAPSRWCTRSWRPSARQPEFPSGSSTPAAPQRRPPLLEEGGNTPADVVFLQDPGSLGSLAGAEMLTELPQEILGKVDSRLRDPNGRWVGTSGRARTVIYNTESIHPETDLPASILDFTSEEWKGRVGWAPRNGSFQSFVTALRLQIGEEGARKWLEGMKDNDAQEYPNNVSIVQAAANGEVDVGFVNHYYLERFLEELGEGFEARNHFIGNGDPGALVLVAGAGILNVSENKATAEEFIDFLLSETAQRYFTSDVKEYPVAAGVVPEGDLPPLESLDPPDVDLGRLSDLQGTLDLLREVGVLP